MSYSTQEYTVKVDPCLLPQGTYSKIGKSDQKFIDNFETMRMGKHNDKLWAQGNDEKGEEINYTETPNQSQTMKHAILLFNGSEFILFKVDSELPKGESPWNDFKPWIKVPTEIANRLYEESEKVTSEEKVAIKAKKLGQESDKPLEADNEPSIKQIFAERNEQEENEEKKLRKKSKKQKKFKSSKEELDFDEQRELFDDDEENDKVQTESKTDMADSDDDLFSTNGVTSFKKTEEKSKNETKEFRKILNKKEQEDKNESNSDVSDDEFEEIDKQDTNMLVEGYNSMFGNFPTVGFEDDSEEIIQTSSGAKRKQKYRPDAEMEDDMRSKYY